MCAVTGSRTELGFGSKSTAKSAHENESTETFFVVLYRILSHGSRLIHGVRELRNQGDCNRPHEISSLSPLQTMRNFNSDVLSLES